MKNLLIKEIQLTSMPITFIFLLFAFMTLIPGYPILMGAFFICLGIFFSFQNGRETNDILY
ncbi:MAG: ABC-2 transporter permease, partial [Paucilactobacillus nenjiangensis]